MLKFYVENQAFLCGKIVRKQGCVIKFYELVFDFESLLASVAYCISIYGIFEPEQNVISSFSSKLSFTLHFSRCMRVW